MKTILDYGIQRVFAVIPQKIRSNTNTSPLPNVCQFITQIAILTIWKVSATASICIGLYGRKIRLKEDKPKCHHLKNLTCKETLRQVFIGLRPRTPYQPLHTAYADAVYLSSVHTGRGGEVEPERRLEGQRVTKLGRKYRHH